MSYTKKFILTCLFALCYSLSFSQNVQMHYDFGHLLYSDLQLSKKDNTLGKAPLTTTVEMFRPDTLGSLFFFVDMDYSHQSVFGAYWEISHEFCFWKKSKANWLSIHAEYNGGLDRRAGSYNDAWLIGLTYSGHSNDYTKTWSLSGMYKAIPNTVELDSTKNIHQFQITAVWGIAFANGWCTFSGFVAFRREPRCWPNTDFIIISEPQFWVNLNKIKGWDRVNLSVGTEVELSNNF